MKFNILFIIIILFSEPMLSISEKSTIINEVDNSNIRSLLEMERPCYAYCFHIVQPVLEHTVSIQTKEQQIQEQSITIRNLEIKLADLQAKVGIYEETLRSKDVQLAHQLLACEKYTNETNDKFKVYEETIKNKDLKLTDATYKIGIYEESVKNKDLKLAEQLHSYEKYRIETTDKFRVYEETIKTKELQLTQNMIDSEKSKNEISVKLGICEDTSQKLKNEAIDRNKVIMQKNELQSQLKEQLIEYKVKSEKCVSSSCIGKLTDIYDVKVPGMEAFPVSCDSSLAGSGWTVIQRRMDGSVNFNRSWNEYRQGFGNLNGEFFIGLEKLHLLTQSQPHELYISLMDLENKNRHASYSDFVVGSEEEFYKLKTIGLYSGDAGDAMTEHKNLFFSTPDRDNDKSQHDCGAAFSSGWWFGNCYHCNLNGIYSIGETSKKNQIIAWNAWELGRQLRFSQMMIKPKN